MLYWLNSNGVHNKRYLLSLRFISLACLLACLSSCSLWSTGASSSTLLNVQQAPNAHLSYVALGASDSWGTGARDPDEQNWPHDLARKLGSQTHLVNVGIPGITLHDALNIELPVALDVHPNLVTIWLAVDDLLADTPIDSYTQDLDSLLTRLQANSPHVQIALANVPDLTLLPRFQTDDDPSTLQSLPSQITAYNNAIEAVAQRHHIILVDLYKEWSVIANHPEYISSDGFHPSTEGYAQLAEIFYQTLQAAHT
jgi:lysophospholipase L1-like esterase